MARLELDKPVSDYLAEWKSRTDPTPITVRQLLAHTSGLPFASAAELAHPGGLDSHGRCYHLDAPHCVLHGKVTNET